MVLQKGLDNFLRKNLHSSDSSNIGYEEVYFSFYNSLNSGRDEINFLSWKGLQVLESKLPSFFIQAVYGGVFLQGML